VFFSVTSFLMSLLFLCKFCGGRHIVWGDVCDTVTEGVVPDVLCDCDAFIAKGKQSKKIG
jgi:hypothetical protein